MAGNDKRTRYGLKIFLKSAVLAGICIILAVIGFIAAGYFFGG